MIWLSEDNYEVLKKRVLDILEKLNGQPIRVIEERTNGLGCREATPQPVPGKQVQDSEVMREHSLVIISGLYSTQERGSAMEERNQLLD